MSLAREIPGPHARLQGLDAVRAFAVMLVILFHQRVALFGWAGVQIFFVLSGYLITGLLRKSAAAPLTSYLWSFYGRRSLRIFPLYYLVLLLMLVALWGGVELPNVRPGLPYAATYTYNIWHATSAFVHSELISHFWSLCVEEQFYLLWPLFIYYCPPRHIRKALLTLVVAGPFVRLGTYLVLSLPEVSALKETSIAVYTLTPSHVDAFAIGGYFALFPLGGARRAFMLAFGCLLAVGIAIKITHGLPWRTLGLPLGLESAYGFVWAYTLMNVVSALLIDCLVHGKLLPGLIEQRWLKFLGQISYGIYVFHYPVQWAVSRVLPSYSSLIQILVQVVITIAIASLSYFAWELWFLNQKDKWFPVATKHAAKSRA